MVDIRTVSRVVIAAVLYYVGVTALLHFLEPDMGPVANPMSAYVLTDSGALMTTTYFFQAIALIALVVGLRRVMQRSIMPSIGLVLFSVAAVTAGIAGVFPGESPPPQTLSGIIHLTCGVVYSFATAAAVVLITLSVRKDARWQGVAALVTWLAVGVVIGTALFPMMAPVGGGGLAQRISFAVAFAWMIVVAYEMPKIATGVYPTPEHAVRS
jgi:MFS family permease